MWKALVIGLAIVAGACGGKTGVYKHDYAGSLTLTLENRTPRVIEQVFIHPMGTDRGTSWTDAIPPGASVTVKIQPGNFEIVAVSAKRKLDEHTRERPEATSMLELKRDLRLVFHDQGGNPAGLTSEGVLGVQFQISEPEPTPSPGASEGSGAAPESGSAQ